MKNISREHIGQMVRVAVAQINGPSCRAGPGVVEMNVSLLKKADAMIRFFEEKGRCVVGVAFRKDEIRLEFHDLDEKPFNSAELVSLE